MPPDSTPGLAFRIFLPTFFVAVILLGGVLRTWSFRRRYGFDPLKIAEPDQVLEFGEAYRNGLFLVILAFSFSYLLWPDINDFLGPIWLLEGAGFRLVGVVVMVVSLAILLIAQAQMGRSWRFGLDRANPPEELITSGLFSLSRNPIYLAMITMSGGFFLAISNALTFTVVNVAFVLLQTRVRAEEAFLRDTWGEAFDGYCERTPRWLFRRGRPQATRGG